MTESTTVALAGDWHGNGAWARSRVTSLGERGVSTLLHLGDFGVWPGPSGRKYVEGVENSCRRYGITIYVTPGNHEDYRQIHALVPEVRDAFGPIGWLTDHIAVLPRGHRFGIEGRSFVSLGGAPSIDYEWRTPGESWWSQEMIEPEDVARVAEAGHAEVMLAHDSPGAPYWVPAVEAICTSASGWSLDALTYTAVGRKRMTEAFESIQPLLFAHGHYHARDEALVDLPDGAQCRIVSTGMDGEAGNVALLDLGSLHVEWV